MKKENTTPEKMFYTIGEVSRIFKVNASLLRFWEDEFDIIRPRKSVGGTRHYSKPDIENIRLVHHLVKERKMTLEGAKTQLKKNKAGLDRTQDVITRLKEIKAELKAIANELV